jgi:hypothetical protein
MRLWNGETESGDREENLQRRSVEMCKSYATGIGDRSSIFALGTLLQNHAAAVRYIVT